MTFWNLNTRMGFAATMSCIACITGLYFGTDGVTTTTNQISLIGGMIAFMCVMTLGFLVLTVSHIHDKKPEHECKCSVKSKDQEPE